MKRLFKEKGQGLVEYALILVLVAVIVIAILLMLGPTIGNAFSSVAEKLKGLGIGGGAGAITGVSVSGGGFGQDLVITVSVSTSTKVSLSGSVTHSGKTCNGSCTFNFAHTSGHTWPHHGSVTASADDGSTGSASW